MWDSYRDGKTGYRRIAIEFPCSYVWEPPRFGLAPFANCWGSIRAQWRKPIYISDTALKTDTVTVYSSMERVRPTHVHVDLGRIGDGG